MLNQATIVVAEDDRAFRELLLLALTGLGFQTVPAANAEELLAALEYTSVDLLLLDLQLGEDNGIDILKKARQRSAIKQPAVLLLTGCSDQRAVLEAAKLGVRGYILKQQLSHTDLSGRIRQCIHDVRSPPASAINKKAPVSARLSNDVLTPRIDHSRAIATAPVDGDAADRLRALGPVMARADVIALADKAAGLKALSPTVRQLLDMTNRPDYSLDQIAQVIKRDPVIVIKVLKIAKSVAYGRAGGMDTVQKALSRIGLARIRQLILNISIIDQFHFNSLDEYFNGQLFWEHSIATALIAASIAQFRNGNEGGIDAAFTAGLLHDVGRIIFVEQLGDTYQRIAETARREQLPLEHVESRMLQCNHADLMERVLKAWGFPAHLLEPIAMHHLSMSNIRALSPQTMTDIGSLALADRLAHAMMLGSSGNETQYPTDDFFQTLGLKPEAIQFIEERIPEQVNEVKHAMLESDHTTVWPDYCKMLREKIKEPVRILYLSANPVGDGYRIFFERLRDNAKGKQPNIAVLYLADVRDRRSLLAKLLDSEKERGIGALPLVVITPLANPQIDPAILSGRGHKILPSPFTFSQWSHAFINLLKPSAN